jgi:hypothetical protein
MDAKRSTIDCKFPAFNSGKTIEKQIERSLHKQNFLKYEGGQGGEFRVRSLEDFSGSDFHPPQNFSHQHMQL